MSRAMRRFKQALSQGECKEILGAEPRGVLSVIGDDGYPIGVPALVYNERAEKGFEFD